MLKAADMTVQSTQLLHLAEETSDLAQEGGLSKDGADNIWDARFNKIKNLLDPTNPGDAVNLNYITKNQTSLLTQLNNTGAAQNASIVSTGDTQNARLTATGDKQNTRLTSTGDTQNKRLTDTGDSYVATMTTLKNTATDKATEATNQAALAKKWAVSDASPDGATDSKSSKTWAAAAKTSETHAYTSEINAATFRDKAATYQEQAAASATTAVSKASESASSASASAAYASNASTSASNAKISETKAASSAAAAAASADRAAKFDPSSYYTKTETYTKTEVDNKISNIDLSQYATTTYVRAAVSSARSSIEASIPTKTSQLTNDSGFITADTVPQIEQSTGEATKTSYVNGTGTIAWYKVGKLVTLYLKGSITKIDVGYGNRKIFTGLPVPITLSYGEIMESYSSDNTITFLRSTLQVDGNGSLWVVEKFENFSNINNPKGVLLTYVAK